MMPVFVQGRISPALKGLAVGTYVIHLAAQVLDLQTSLPPSTLLFPRSYSPNGYFLSAFSALSAALNIMWLKELLFERNNDDPDVIPSFVYEKDLENVHNASQDTEELALPHDLERHQSVSFKSTYLPIYIIGNILLCLSALSAGDELYDISHHFVVLNFIFQFAHLYILTYDVRTPVITPANFLTHLVMKTNIGLNVLLVWRTWSILNKMENPSIDQLTIISGVLLLATLSSGPDPILGLSILFVLFSLIVGDEDPSTMNTASMVTWQLTFRLLAIVVSACLVTEFIISKRRNFPWLSGWKSSSNRITLP